MKKFALIALSLLSVSASAGIITRETFSLYPTPHHAVNRFCNVHTKATLNYVERTLTLENTVSGVCNRVVEPDVRTYAVAPIENDGCDSWVTTGALEGRGTVSFTDNRRRTCENVVPDVIVVTETDAAGNTVVHYGSGK